MDGSIIEKSCFESVKKPVYHNSFQRCSCCGNILANSTKNLNSWAYVFFGI